MEGCVSMLLSAESCSGGTAAAAAELLPAEALAPAELLKPAAPLPRPACRRGQQWWTRTRPTLDFKSCQAASTDRRSAAAWCEGGQCRQRTCQGRQPPERLGCLGAGEGGGRALVRLAGLGGQRLHCITHLQRALTEVAGVEQWAGGQGGCRLL